jgi:hypothetical protein
VRIAPAADGDPFRTLYFHYGVGSNGFLCRKKNFNESCPVCEFASQLWKEGTDESRNLAKSLFVKERHFSPVLVRGEENESIRWMAYGKEVFETLISLCLNPEYGDITDVETGTDMILSISQPEGQRFPKTSVQPKRKSSKFSEGMDKKIAAEMLKNIPDLNELIPPKTAKEIEDMLAKLWLGEKDDGKESQGKKEKAKFGGGKIEVKETTPEEPASVEKALEELLS